MAPTRFSTDSCGNSSEGTSFDDSTTINDGEVLSRIVLFYREFIDSLTMHYTGSTAPVTHGSNAGSRVEIVLGAGEFITQVTGFFGSSQLAQLRFVNNKGLIFGPYGGEKENNVTSRFDWKAEDKSPPDLSGRMGLHCFSGHASGYIYRLRATFAPYPVVAKPSTAIKFERLGTPEPDASGDLLSSFARNMMSPLVALHVGPDAIVFHANEATLCRIPFFRAALQGHFEESTTKLIRIPEEKPSTISALIEYICTGTYTYTYDDDSGTIPTLAQGCFHVGVYAVAHMYDCPALAAYAMGNFVAVLGRMKGIDVVGLWKAAYARGLTIKVCAAAGRMDGFGMELSGLLKGLYETEDAEMDKMVVEYPALASDFMRFLVTGGGE